jgi:hypothetical protein
VNVSELKRFAECGLRTVDVSGALIREYNRKPVCSRPGADLSMALMSTSNPDYYDRKLF